MSAAWDSKDLTVGLKLSARPITRFCLPQLARSPSKLVEVIRTVQELQNGDVDSVSEETRSSRLTEIWSNGTGTETL